MEIIDFIFDYIRLAQITDYIDIAIVAWIIYFFLRYIKGTQAEGSVKGVGLLLVGTLISDGLNLNTINYLLENLFQVGLIALVVVFQPELRKILERMGKTRFYKHNNHEEDGEDEIFIHEIVTACERLSKEREGALIVFERQDNLTEIIESGVLVDSKITAELVRNIFYPKAPLHDGAMIIRDGKIAAAACILPLSDNHNISKDLGTRHRASVGMTERTDSLCVVVSEESGAISVASKGMLKRHLSSSVLHKILRYELISDEKDDKNTGITDKVINFMKNYFVKIFSSEER
ncbi:MAG: diadenylate cyclase CdaA [Clostridia bacterium]